MPQFADQPGAGGGSRASGIAALLSRLGGDRAMGFGQQLLPQIRPNFDIPPPALKLTRPARRRASLRSKPHRLPCSSVSMTGWLAWALAGGEGKARACSIHPCAGRQSPETTSPPRRPGSAESGLFLRITACSRKFPQVPGQGPAGPPPGLQGIGVTPSPLGLFAQRLATQPTSPAFTTIMAERPPPKPAVDMAPPQLSQPYTTVMPERPQATKVGPQLSQPSPAQLNPYRR